MALTNCTITSTTVNITKGQTIGTTASQVLTITPDAGYCVAAADFTNDTDMTHADISAIIQSITITDSHATPYHDSNTVLVTCDLKNTYTANANKDLIIDIDGDALDKKGRKFTVSGTWDQVVNGNVTAATVTQASSNAYTKTDHAGDASIIISQTYVCASGYYFTAAPTFTKTTVGNYASNYTSLIVPYAWATTGEPTAYAVQVTLTMPQAFESGHNLDISANAVATATTQANLITGISINEDTIAEGGDIRTLKIYGVVGASTRYFVRDDGVTTPDDSWYNFTTDLFSGTSESYSSNVTIPDGTGGTTAGVYEVDIHFPTRNGLSDSLSYKTYFISVIGGTSPATNTTQGSSSNNDAFTKTLNQRPDKTLTVTASGTNLNVAQVSGTTASFTVPYGSQVDSNGDPYNKKTWGITVTSTVSGKVLHVRRNPVISDSVAYNANTNITLDGTESDFTNTLPGSNDGMDFDIKKMEATGTGTTTVTIKSATEGFAALFGGTSNVTSNLNLDNIINKGITANSTTFNGTEDVDLTMDLSSAVAAGNESQDTLTYSIVADNTGSNGTLTLLDASTGSVKFDNATNWAGTTSFTWKVNDGFEDSNTATATVVLAQVNETPTAIALSANTQAENTAINTTIGAFSTTDPDSGDTFTYTLVSGTGSTDNASFNISGANLRNSAVFDYETKNSYSIRVRSTDAGGLYTEAQFTINVTDVSEGVGRWLMEVYDSSGSATGVQFYISDTQFCDSGSLSAIPGSCFGLNKFVRYVTTAGGCSSTVMAAGKIINQSVADGPIGAYIHGSGATWYNSAQDAHNSTNGVTC